MSDIRDAYRALRSTPLVTTVAVLSLALGMGANTAIFSIVDSLLLRNLPVRQPERLVALISGDQVKASWTNPIWEQIRDRPELFNGAFAWHSDRLNQGRGGEAEWVTGLWVSGGMLDVL